MASASCLDTRASDACAAAASLWKRIGVPSAAKVANGGSSGIGS
jgi:hypothetical protein